MPPRRGFLHQERASISSLEGDRASMSSSRRITPPGGSAMMSIHTDENSRGGNSRSSRTSNHSDRLPSRGRSLLRSRSPGIMQNLFGRRGRRSRKSEDQLPTADEIFFGPSVPAYIRNGNGWENMHPSAYKEYNYIMPETAGAPYALSNIPAQIYILQPQQHPVSLPGTEIPNGPVPRFPPGSQSMAIPPMGATQPMPGPVYTAVYPPTMQPGGPATARPPMMPIPKNGTGTIPTSAARVAADTTDSIDTEAMDRRRMSSTRTANEWSDGSPPPSRQRKRGHHHRVSSPLSRSPSHGYRKDHRSGTLDRDEKRKKRHRSVSENMQIKHICNGCGRVRSRKFHDANPIRPGKKPIPNYCRKCRDASHLADNAQEWEDDMEDGNAALEEKKWQLPSETSYGGSVLSLVDPRPISVASAIPEDEDEDEASSCASVSTAKEAAEATAKTPKEEHSALRLDSVLTSETGCTLDDKPQTVKSKNKKSAHSYRHPTIESVVDASEKHDGTVKVNGACSTASKTETASPKMQCVTGGKEALTLDALDETDKMEYAEFRTPEVLRDQSHGHVKTADQVDRPCSRHFSYPMDENNGLGKSTVNGDPVRTPLSPCQLQSPSMDHRRSTLDPLCGNCHYHSTYVSTHQGCQFCHHNECGGAFGCGHHSQVCQSSHCNSMFAANGCGHRSDAPAEVPCQGRHASEQVHVPRTFSMHTASPTVVSEHVQKENDTSASPIVPGGDRDEELDAWLSGKMKLQDDCDAATPVSDDCTEYGEDYQTSSGIPPYNFDLFSERAHSRGSSPFPAFSYPQGQNRRRGSIGSVDSSDSNGDGNGAVVPEYNFDLFSDVADRWNAYDDSDSSSSYHAAGYGGANRTMGKRFTALEDKTNRKANTSHRVCSRAAYAFSGEKENMGMADGRGSTVSAFRRAFEAGVSSRVSFEIKECEDDTDIDGLGKKVRHIVDCEVISNPDSTSECSQVKWSTRARTNGSQVYQHESLLR